MHTRKKPDKRDEKLASAKVDTTMLAAAATVAEEAMDASCSKKPNESIDKERQGSRRKACTSKKEN